MTKFAEVMTWDRSTVPMFHSVSSANSSSGPETTMCLGVISQVASASVAPPPSLMVTVKGISLILRTTNVTSISLLDRLSCSLSMVSPF